MAGRTVHCIYHGGCPDGFAAYWALQYSFGLSGVEVTPHAGRYGEPPPVDIPAGATVYIVDFSYPRDVLVGFASRMGHVTVFDHHQTAQADLEGTIDNVTVVFDMGRSGAGITWDEMAGGERPWLLDMVEARDLWRMDQPDVPAAGAFVMSLPHTLEAWEQAMLRSARASMLDAGEGALAARGQMVAAAVEQAAWYEVGGSVLPMVNVQYSLGSEVADALMKRFDVDLAGYFLVGAGEGGDVWQYGFRSRGDVDCSVLALMFGGGGHMNAAGCRGRRIHWAALREPMQAPGVPAVERYGRPLPDEVETSMRRDWGRHLEGTA